MPQQLVPIYMYTKITDINKHNFYTSFIWKKQKIICMYFECMRVDFLKSQRATE